MKRIEVLSIALVAIMTLTVISGAGMITVGATDGYAKPVVEMTATLNGNPVDPTQPVPIGQTVTAHWTLVNKDPSLVMRATGLW